MFQTVLRLIALNAYLPTFLTHKPTEKVNIKLACWQQHKTCILDASRTAITCPQTYMVQLNMTQMWLSHCVKQLHFMQKVFFTHGSTAGRTPHERCCFPLWSTTHLANRRLDFCGRKSVAAFSFWKVFPEDV